MGNTYDADWVAAYALGLAASGLSTEVCVDELGSVAAGDRYLVERAHDLVCREDRCTAAVCGRARLLLEAVTVHLPR